jgi:hypothetical protein
MSLSKTTIIEHRRAILDRTVRDLSYRTDLKFRSGCWRIKQHELSLVQERVLAQIYGMLWPSSDSETLNRAFAFLLAHAGWSKNDFRLERTTYHQWPAIIGKYFNSNWHYAELAILEKILLTILRTKKPSLLKDVRMADRLADTGVKTDWLFHLGLHHGLFRLGVQVTTANHIVAKVGGVLNRPMSDIAVFDQVESPFVLDLLRHGTCVLAFNHFSTPIGDLPGRRDNLLWWSRTYQSRLISERNADFRDYGHWIFEILEVLDAWIRDRVIDRHRRMENISFEHRTKDGNLIQVKLVKINREHVIIMEFYKKWKWKWEDTRPIVFALPLTAEVLDVYRDMAGVRSQ